MRRRDRPHDGLTPAPPAPVRRAPRCTGAVTASSGPDRSRGRRLVRMRTGAGGGHAAFRPDGPSPARPCRALRSGRGGGGGPGGRVAPCGLDRPCGDEAGRIDRTRRPRRWRPMRWCACHTPSGSRAFPGRRLGLPRSITTPAFPRRRPGPPPPAPGAPGGDRVGGPTTKSGPCGRPCGRQPPPAGEVPGGDGAGRAGPRWAVPGRRPPAVGYRSPARSRRRVVATWILKAQGTRPSGVVMSRTSATKASRSRSTLAPSSGPTS